MTIVRWLIVFALACQLRSDLSDSGTEGDVEQVLEKAIHGGQCIERNASAARVDCLFSALYGEANFYSEAEDVLGGEGTYGEILPGGVEKIFDTTAAMGASLGSDDAFFDLGSGVGKVVLQAYLTTHVQSAIGIELESNRHEAAVGALASLQQMVGPPASNELSAYVGFMRGDIRDSSVWRNASVVHASTLAFPKDLLLEITWALSGTLQAGALVFVYKLLPGCHRGLRYVGSFRASMSFHDSLDVYVYIVPPIELSPSQWINIDETSWLADKESHFGTIVGGTSLDHLSSLMLKRWLCESGSCRKRALRMSGSLLMSTSSDSMTLARNRSADSISLDKVMSTITHMVRGERTSAMECLFVDLVAATVAEEQNPGHVITQLFGPRQDGAIKPVQESAAVAIEHLLVHRIDLNLRDRAGRTLLSYASETDSRLQKTPLHYASASSSTDSVIALLDRRAHVNAKDVDGNTPLHSCIPRGKTTAMASKLLEAGAEPEATTIFGVTPLAQACMFGHVEMVKLLLKYRASPSKADKAGVKPIEYAKLSGNAELLALVSPKAVGAQEL